MSGQSDTQGRHSLGSRRLDWLECGYTISEHLPRIPRFDPMPFSLLGTIVAMEAILLASLILMSQSRLARRADEREHLVLQILLLTEKEVTAVISMNQQIASKVGLSDMENSKEIEQLSQNTSIDEVAQDIQRSLSEDVK